MHLREKRTRAGSEGSFPAPDVQQTLPAVEQGECCIDAQVPVGCEVLFARDLLAPDGLIELVFNL
jgi:hypothetical protein